MRATTIFILATLIAGTLGAQTAQTGLGGSTNACVDRDGDGYGWGPLAIISTTVAGAIGAGVNTVTPASMVGTITGTTTLNSTSVTAMDGGETNTATLQVGSSVSGTGIPANTTIAAIAATGKSITLSQQATASGTVTLSIGIVPGSTLVIDQGSNYETVSVTATTLTTFTFTALIPHAAGFVVRDLGCLGVDVDDLDASIHTTAQGLAKYGDSPSGPPTNLLKHLGYTPLRQWYISPGGNDSTCIASNAPVGIGSPCLTATPVTPHLLAGDAVLYRGGTYTANAQRFVPTVSGTSANPILMLGYPGEDAFWDGSTTFNGPFVGNDVAFITVDNFRAKTCLNSGCFTGGNSLYGNSTNPSHDLTFRHLSGNNNFRLILISGYDNLTIEDSVAYDGTENGFYIGPKGELLASNGIIRRCIAFNNGFNGFHVNGKQTNLQQDQNISYLNSIGNFDWQNGVSNSFFRSNVSFAAGNGGFNFSVYGSKEGITGCGLASGSGTNTCVCPGTFPYNHANDEGASCGNNMTGNLIENFTHYETDRGYQNVDESGVSALFVVRQKGLPTPCLQNATISAVTYIGGGLKDGTFSGAVTDVDAIACYMIDSTGSPDTFKWSLDTCVTFKATGVPITGGGVSQTLSNGLSIAFAASTGHTLNEEGHAQTFVATPACYASDLGTGNVARNIIGVLDTSITSPGTLNYQPMRFPDNATGWPQAWTWDSLLMYDTNASHKTAMFGYGSPGAGGFGQVGYTCAQAAGQGITVSGLCAAADPKFVGADPSWGNHPEKFDLRLQGASPAFHAGSAVALPAYDNKGRSFLGAAPSIGGLERNPYLVQGWNQLPNTRITNTALGGAANNVPPNGGPTGLSFCPHNTAGGSVVAGCTPGQLYPYQLQAHSIFTAWSSAVAADIAGSECFWVWGGGHTDYGGNETYRLCLNQIAPTMVRITDPSPIPNNDFTVGFSAMPDGNPSSRHTFGQQVYLADQNATLVWNGSVFGGNGTKFCDLWSFNHSTLAWTLLTPTGVTPVCITSTGVMIYNPVSHTVLMYAGGSVYRYDPATNIASSISSASGSGPVPNGFLDTRRNWMYQIGCITTPQVTVPSTANGCVPGGPTGFFYRNKTPDSAGMDYTALGQTCSQAGGTLATDCPNINIQGVLSPASKINANCLTVANADAPGIEFDFVNDREIVYPQDSLGTVWFITHAEDGTDTYSCTSQSFPGTAPVATGDLLPQPGIYGRFRYFKGLDSYIVLPGFNQNAFALSLVAPDPFPPAVPTGSTLSGGATCTGCQIH